MGYTPKQLRTLTSTGFLLPAPCRNWGLTSQEKTFSVKGSVLRTYSSLEKHLDFRRSNNGGDGWRPTHDHAFRSLAHRLGQKAAPRCRFRSHRSKQVDPRINRALGLGKRNQPLSALISFFTPIDLSTQARQSNRVSEVAPQTRPLRSLV